MHGPVLVPAARADCRAGGCAGLSVPAASAIQDPMEHGRISCGMAALACVLSLASASVLTAQSAGQPAAGGQAFDLSSYVRQAVAVDWDCASAANDWRKAEDAYELSKQERRALFDAEALRIDAATRKLRLREATAAAVLDAMTSYFSLLQAQRTRQAGVQAVAIREEYAKLALTRMKEGVAQEEDWLDQDLLLRGARLSLMNGEASLAKARRQFLRMVNLDTESDAALSAPDPSAFLAQTAEAKEYLPATLLQKAMSHSSAYADAQMKHEYARRRYEVLTNPAGSVSPKETERLLWESRSAEHAHQVQSAAVEDAVTDLLLRRDSLGESLAMAEQKKAVAEKKLASQKIRLSHEFVLQVDVMQAESSLYGEEAGLQKVKEDLLIHALRILAAAGTDILALFADQR